MLMICYHNTFLPGYKVVCTRQRQPNMRQSSVLVTISRSEITFIRGYEKRFYTTTDRIQPSYLERFIVKADAVGDSSN